MRYSIGGTLKLLFLLVYVVGCINMWRRQNICYSKILNSKLSHEVY